MIIQCNLQVHATVIFILEMTIVISMRLPSGYFDIFVYINKTKVFLPEKSYGRPFFVAPIFRPEMKKLKGHDMNQSSARLISQIRNAIDFLSDGRCTDSEQALKLDNVTQTRLDLLKHIIDDSSFSSYSQQTSTENNDNSTNVHPIISEYNEFDFFCHSHISK